MNLLLSPTDVQTKDFGQHPDENRSKEEPAIPDGGGSERRSSLTSSMPITVIV